MILVSLHYKTRCNVTISKEREYPITSTNSKMTRSKLSRPTTPSLMWRSSSLQPTTCLARMKFPCDNDYWEEFDVGQRMWIKWKTTYRAVAKKATIKKKPAEGKYQFGDGRNSIQQPVPTQPWGAPMIYAQPISLEALDRYFENLVTAETNRKHVLEKFSGQYHHPHDQ